MEYHNIAFEMHPLSKEYDEYFRRKVFMLVYGEALAGTIADTLFDEISRMNPTELGNYKIVFGIEKMESK